MFNYDPIAHGEYLGQYGWQKQPDGTKTPLVRVDKSKKNFYSKLNLTKKERKDFNLARLIIANAIASESNVANWRLNSYGNPGVFYEEIFGAKKYNKIKKQIANLPNTWVNTISEEENKTTLNNIHKKIFGYELQDTPKISKDKEYNKLQKYFIKKWGKWNSYYDSEKGF